MKYAEGTILVWLGNPVGRPFTFFGGQINPGDAIRVIDDAAVNTAGIYSGLAAPLSGVYPPGILFFSNEVVIADDLTAVEKAIYGL